jgi:hypothetical protein
MELHIFISIFLILLSAVQVQATSSTTSPTEAMQKREEAKEVNNNYALLSAEANNGNELEVLENIAAQSDYVEYYKWKVAVKDDWMKLYLVYQAIKSARFWFALLVFNDISNAEIINIMKEGTYPQRHEWILYILERTVNNYNFSDNGKENATNLRNAIVKKLYNENLVAIPIETNIVDHASSILKPYAALIDRFLHTELSKKYFFSANLLKKSIELDRPGIVGILLSNHKQLNAIGLPKALEELGKLNLYMLTKSPATIKLLLKHNIPIIWEPVSGQLRIELSRINPLRKRYEMFDLVHLTSEGDKSRLKTMLSGDYELTVREAIMSRSSVYLSAVFHKKEVGFYKEGWLQLAIKFCGYSCFLIISMERAPYLTEKDFEDALALAIDPEKKGEYREMYNHYKNFYYKNICFYGPIGCNEVQYNAHMQLNYPDDDILKDKVNSDSTNYVSLMIKNYIKLQGGYGTKAFDALDKLKLYSLAKSPQMIKKLKESKVPVIWTLDSLVVRGNYEKIVPETKRSEMLDLLKLTTKTEKEKFKELNGNNDRMSVEEAIRTGNHRKLAGVFLRNNLGVYQKEWFNMAIKFCGSECAKVLLKERVPILDQNELETAIAPSKESDKAMYRTLFKGYRKYYNDGKCIDGPLGCDKQKYEDWMRSQGQTVIGGGGGGGGGGGDATRASECTPLA